MKINYEKLLEIKDKSILEAFGFHVTNCEIVGELIIEEFENGDFRLIKSIEEKGHFYFQYQFTKNEVFQIAIYLGKRLMFVKHSGEWRNYYSDDSCNFDTGKGIVGCMNTYTTFQDCIENRYKDAPEMAEDSIAEKTYNFAVLNENIEAIKIALMSS